MYRASIANVCRIGSLVGVALLASCASAKPVPTANVATTVISTPSTKSTASTAPSTSAASAGATTAAQSAPATNGTDYSPQICEAIIAAQTGLAADEQTTGLPAPPAAYLAQFVLKLSAASLPAGTNVIVDSKVEAMCGEPYRTFLKQAGITSLAAAA